MTIKVEGINNLLVVTTDGSFGAQFQQTELLVSPSRNGDNVTISNLSDRQETFTEVYQDYRDQNDNPFASKPLLLEYLNSFSVDSITK